MFWYGVLTGAILGGCLAVVSIGLVAVGGRADLELELMDCQEKIRKILHGELPK